MCMASKVDTAVRFPQALHSAFVTVKIGVEMEKIPVMRDSRSPRKVVHCNRKVP